MSRLQLLVAEEELEEIRAASRARQCTVSEFVRDCIRRGLRSERPQAPEQRLAAILRYAKYAGPTGDIDAVLSEIERGRALG